MNSNSNSISNSHNTHMNSNSTSISNSNDTHMNSSSNSIGNGNNSSNNTKRGLEYRIPRLHSPVNSWRFPKTFGDLCKKITIP